MFNLEASSEAVKIQQVNTDAIKAAGDIVSQLTAAAVKGAVQGAK